MQHVISTLSADEGEVLWVLGDRLRLLGELPGTGHHVALLSVPPGGGPPVHTHASPELFHVTSGELTFHTIEAGRACARVARAGDTVAVPSGAPHGFQNLSGTDATALVWFDASLLAFFRAVGSAAMPPPGPPPPEELQRIVGIARQHGMTIVQPQAEE